MTEAKKVITISIEDINEEDQIVVQGGPGDIYQQDEFYFEMDELSEAESLAEERLTEAKDEGFGNYKIKNSAR